MLQSSIPNICEILRFIVKQDYDIPNSLLPKHYIGRCHNIILGNGIKYCIVDDIEFYSSTNDMQLNVEQFAEEVYKYDITRIDIIWNFPDTIFNLESIPFEDESIIGIKFYKKYNSVSERVFINDIGFRPSDRIIICYDPNSIILGG